MPLSNSFCCSVRVSSRTTEARDFDMARTISFFIAVIFILESRICRSHVDPNNKTSWKTALIYDARFEKVFKNFQDVIDELQYLKDLHVDTIWLGPVFQWSEHFYAVTNYTQISPSFGDMNDFERLLKDARSYGIKCILVIMPYFTSNQHTWFKKWERGESPYNNFYATFKTNSTQMRWSAKRNEWYLAPWPYSRSLNLLNEDVRRQLKDELFLFWLDKGVDGFAIVDLHENMNYITECSSENKTIAEVNKDYLREIRNVVNAWATKNKSEYKYLAVVTNTSAEQSLAYYEKKDAPDVMPINENMFPYSKHGKIATTVKAIIEKQLSPVHSNKSTTWMVYDHMDYRSESVSDLRFKLWMESFDALNMLNMLLPGPAFLRHIRDRAARRKDVWSSYNLTANLGLLRKRPVFQRGGCNIATLNNDAVLVLKRSMSDDPTVYVVVCNFGDAKETVNLTALFPDLQEELPIVLTSDTNKSLRGLTSMPRDSITVSPGAGTVLQSDRERRDSERGGADTKDKDNRKVTDSAEGGRESGNTGEIAANLIDKRGKDNTRDESAGKKDEGRRVQKTTELDNKNVEKRGEEGNGGEGDTSGRNSNGTGEQGKNDTSDKPAGKGDEGRRVQKTTEREGNVSGEDEIGTNVEEARGAENTDEDGPNGASGKDKGGTSLESAGKEDKGRGNEKTPERNNKNVEKRGDEENEDDGDTSGSNANKAGTNIEEEAEEGRGGESIYESVKGLTTEDKGDKKIEAEPATKDRKVNTDHGREIEWKKKVWGMWRSFKQLWRYVNHPEWKT